MKVLHQHTDIYISKYDGVNYLELIIRIVAGLFIILNGLHILNHNPQLVELFSHSMGVPFASFLLIFIGSAHLFGGTFIVIGLFTRVVIILQIPAILAEIYYIQPPNSFLGSSEIFASALLMIPLFFLVIKNSGKFSLDYYRMKKKEAKGNQE